MARAHHLNTHSRVDADGHRFFDATSPYLTWAVVAFFGVMMTFAARTPDDPSRSAGNQSQKTATAKRNMTVMIGAQSLRSCFEGVIQFSTMLNAFTARAIQSVQDGQPGQ